MSVFELIMSMLSIEKQVLSGSLDGRPSFELTSFCLRATREAENLLRCPLCN